MKAVEEALAKTLGIMVYYSDLSKRLNDKLSYIARIKQERNTAQDSLSEIRNLFHIGDNEDVVQFLKNVKKQLDNPQ